MDTATQDITTKIIDFLNGIGVPVTFRTLETDCLLPGITIEDEGLVVDREKLLYPGDLLHEAGHIAVAPPGYRKTLRGNIDTKVDFKYAGELMAIAWSYAAALHIGIDPAIVFHDDGYHGQGQDIVNGFMHGQNIGVPALQWAEMTAVGEKAKELGVPPFPHMIRWVREHEVPVKE